MSSGDEKAGMSAAVLFSTRFGTTERIAKAFESGLKEAGMETLCSSTQEVTPDSLKRYDLICVGGPTEVFGASKPMKEFLDEAKKVDLGGKLGFAFDTKIDSRLSGSAAKYIENSLDDQGLHLVARRESAIVTTRKEGGKIAGAILKEGEEKRFEQLGFQVGTAATKTMASIHLP